MKSIQAGQINALLMAIAEDPSVLEAVAMAARRLAGTAIIVMAITEAGMFGAEFAAAVEGLFEALPPESSEPLELRVLGSGPEEIIVHDLRSSQS